MLIGLRGGGLQCYQRGVRLLSAGDVASGWQGARYGPITTQEP